MHGPPAMEMRICQLALLVGPSVVRTHGLFVPNEARYQTALRPDTLGICRIAPAGSEKSPNRPFWVSGNSEAIAVSTFVRRHTSLSPMLQRIHSGGQTGADIAALEVALDHDFPHGGWCPKGRRSLAGPIPDCFQLVETPSDDYLQRTEWNVRDTDGTVVFTLAEEATGGSLKTIEYARKHKKPWLHLSQAEPGLESFSARLLAFIDEHSIETLNVAGSRESKEPGIHDWVREVLEAAFFS